MILIGLALDLCLAYACPASTSTSTCFASLTTLILLTLRGPIESKVLLTIERLGATSSGKLERVKQTVELLRMPTPSHDLSPQVEEEAWLKMPTPSHAFLPQRF